MEQKNSALLSAGLAAITLFVLTKNISDPVNAPKLLFLGLTSFFALAFLVFPHLKYLYVNFRLLLVIAVLTLLVMIISSFVSESPFSQNWYGVLGRNTGFLAHLGFIILTIAVLTFREIQSIDKVLLSLAVSGLVNIIYGAWVLMFGDFIGWNNQYKSLLGTFGNPNFISAFLGICTSFCISFLFLRNRTWLQYSIALGLLIVSVYEIAMTKSVQGFILVAVAIFINTFYYLHAKFNNIAVDLGYLFLGLIISIFGILGLSGVGPLANVLFQETFNYRKQYWLAGIEMGLRNPLTGVGLDSYGDWYRETRTLASTISPGLDVVTNVAHNIYIDAFASGGIPFLLCYLTPTLFALMAIIRVSSQMEFFEYRFVVLVSIWFGYQIQSLISISQIGLSVWGWVFSGLIIVYPKLISNKIGSVQVQKEKSKNRETQQLMRIPTLLLASGIAVLIYSPPLIADYRWTIAYMTRDASKLYTSLEQNYFSPSNSFRLAQAAQIFETSNLTDQSHTLAQRATKFNARNFDGWQLLYYVKNSTTEEKILAKEMMIKLDPLNPKWKQLE